MAFPRLGNLLTQSLFNGILDRIERLNRDLVGRGVMSGLVITAGTGLTVNISAGWAVGVAPTVVAAISASPVPASSTRFVWVDVTTGSVTLTLTSTDPGGELVCLGSVTTSGVAVTSISSIGRVDLPRFVSHRLWEVGAGLLQADLDAGLIKLGPSEDAAESAVITATRVLTTRSTNIQRIQCASGQKVLLPNPSDVALGRWFEIVNDNAGGGASITVRDHTDATTIATVAPEAATRFVPNFGRTAWINR